MASGSWADVATDIQLWMGVASLGDVDITLGVMRTVRLRCWVVAASAAWCGIALAADPFPPALLDVTSIEVAAKPCGGQVSKSWRFTDHEQIRALLVEFETIRGHPTGIHAAKIGCSTIVTFARGEQSLASIHLLECTALERAPVSGKRFFTYRAGLNHLPVLNHWLGRNLNESSCQ